MFVVFLKFSANKERADAFMDGHNAWLKRGFDDGVFVLAGSLPPRLGGGILAHGISRMELDARLAEDPFVAEGIVSAEVTELAPAKADPRLDFLTA